MGGTKTLHWGNRVKVNHYRGKMEERSFLQCQRYMGTWRGEGVRRETPLPKKPQNQTQNTELTLWVTWQKSRVAGMPVYERGEASGAKWTHGSPPDICSWLEALQTSSCHANEILQHGNELTAGWGDTPGTSLLSLQLQAPTLYPVNESLYLPCMHPI